MLSTFPSIDSTKEIPIKNISIGEYYYIQSGNDLFHGKVDHVTKQCVQLSRHRKAIREAIREAISSAVCDATAVKSIITYILAPTIFSTFSWKFGEPEQIIEEVNICATINNKKSILATGMSNNTVMLWDLTTLKNIQTLGKTASEWAMCVKFNPQSTMVAAGSTDSSVRIWCTLTYTLLHLIPYNGTYINEISFTPDGEILVFNGGGNDTQQFKIMFWSIGEDTDAECINYLPISKFISFYHNPVNGADDVVLPDHFNEVDNVYVNSFDICECHNSECHNSALVIASITINAGVSAVALWRFQKRYTTSRMLNLRRFSNIFTKVICHSSGDFAFASGIDGDIHVMQFPDLNILYTISLTSAQINTFSLNPLKNKLIASTRDGGTHVYNIEEERFEWGRHAIDPENYDEELDLVMTVEFGLGERHYVSCTAYEIIRAPLKNIVFIADEFLIELIAEWCPGSASGTLPDAAKWLIREFVSGVAQV
jgi:WD40 repeat protein